MQMKWWLYVNVYIVASIYVYWVFLFRSSGRIWHTLWRKRVWFINIWGRMHVPLASYQTSTSQYKLHASNRMFYIVLFRKNVFFFQILLFCRQRSHVLPPKFPPNILDVFWGKETGARPRTCKPLAKGHLWGVTDKGQLATLRGQVAGHLAWIATATIRGMLGGWAQRLYIRHLLYVKMMYNVYQCLPFGWFFVGEKARILHIWKIQA